MPSRPLLGSKSIRVALVLVSVTVPAVYFGLWGHRWGLDLQVYRDGTSDLLHGGDPYRARFTVERLPYTYPPAALVLLAPLDVLPLAATRVAWWVLSGACVAGAIWTVVRSSSAGRRLGPDAVTLMTGIGCVLLEPVRSTLAFGQVNAALMALVAVDLLTATRLRGIGVGVAAALKLTPLFFVVLLLVERDWSAVRRMLFSFAVLTGATWLLFPGISTEYWLHQLLQVSRIGNLGYVGNQSLMGALHRLGMAGGLAFALWALASALVVAAVVLVVRHLHAYGARAVAVLVVAIGALLVSPISWSHHWIWVCLLPAIMLTDDYRRLPLPSAARSVPWGLLGLCILAPYWWNIGGPLGTVADDALVIGGTLLLAVWASVLSRACRSRPEPNGVPPVVTVTGAPVVPRARTAFRMLRGAGSGDG